MPEGNQFLQDQKKALALIGKIIGGRKTAPEKKRTNLFRRIDRLIDEQLLDTLNEAGLEEELAFSERLRLLSDKIDQLGKFELLEHKAIIGVGGQFSAGKSTFINSLIGKEAVLPQNVSVTTSISTYIVCGEKHQNSAYTTNHQFVMLADEEYKALTHEFTKRYVGFSRFVDNIILERPDFSDNIVAMSDTGRNSSDLWKNVAFLDTPGYNKARDRQQEQFTDRKQAARQLENVDFVIWLLAVENGDLSESDIDFLWDSLGRKLLEYPERVLVVINKAKKKPDDMVKVILGQIKETLCGAGISEKCLVTAYDSFAREELFGQTHIIDFLKKAASLGRNKKDLKDELQEIQKDIQKCLDERLKYEKSREKKLYRAIVEAKFPEYAGSLVDSYHRAVLRQRIIRMCSAKFRNVIKHVNHDLSILVR